jgi:hypothetical protein
MRYLGLVLGSSLGLRWLPAKPVEALASTGTATDRIVTGDCLQEGPKDESEGAEMEICRTENKV